MPLSGIRVLDFSWVIAGPTTTRYLAAMGAEVIKIEAPGRGDPGRATELHTVLGQAKKSIAIDLKKPQAVEIVRALAAKSDILIENFATGVMDRLGLGAEALKAVNPDLIYISASGMGRTGPDAQAVAYGTLLQCYSGFAGLNRHPEVAPRVGFAWLDPMCGLMLAFVAAAALWHRQQEGGVARVDFSMIEAMLWTMAEPLVATQLGAPPKPMGNASTHHAPHGAWRCAGDDDWISVVVRTDEEWRALCNLVPGLSGMASLDLGQRRDAAPSDRCRPVRLGRRPVRCRGSRKRCSKAGIPAAALARHGDLVQSPHLAARGFWDRHGAGVLPGLPWRASFGRTTGPRAGTGRRCRSCARRLSSACRRNASPSCGRAACLASLAAGSARPPGPLMIMSEPEAHGPEEHEGDHGGPRSGSSELPAAIRLVQPLCVLFREIRPGIATLAQLAVEVRLALLVERLPAFLAVRRGLDEQ